MKASPAHSRGDAFCLCVCVFVYEEQLLLTADNYALRLLPLTFDPTNTSLMSARHTPCAAESRPRH